MKAIRNAFESASSIIQSAPSAQQGFEEASELAQFLRNLADEGAAVRADAVARIYQEEELSLAALAEKIGVSKARADQLLRTAPTRSNPKGDKK
jgi:hypothetical protein